MFSLFCRIFLLLVQNQTLTDEMIMSSCDLRRQFLAVVMLSNANYSPTIYTNFRFYKSNGRINSRLFLVNKFFGSFEKSYLGKERWYCNKLSALVHQHMVFHRTSALASYIFGFATAALVYRSYYIRSTSSIHPSFHELYRIKIIIFRNSNFEQRTAIVIEGIAL